MERHLTDPRSGRNRQFPLVDLFRQSIYSRLAGYEDTNDAKRLAVDPMFRMLASRERRETSVALTSTLHCFETEVLTEEEYYQGLARLNTDVVRSEGMRRPTRRVILDNDSSESPIHGTQEQSAYNGHFESVCYHTLFAFNQKGDCQPAKLRPGNVPSVSRWEEVLLPVIARHQDRKQTVVVRADAAFALPPVYEAPELRGVAYAIRLAANQVLERAIGDLLTRPRGRPGHAPLVHHLPLSGRLLGASPASDREGGASPRRVIPAGSRRAKPRRTGTRLSTASARMRSACSWESSRTTSAICYVGWPCRWPSGTGPWQASSSGVSISADASSGLPGTSPCSLPKAT